MRYVQPIPAAYGSTGRATRALLLVLLLGTLAAWGCRSGDVGQAPPAPLTLSLAIQAVPHSGLIAIAEDKGFFKDAGLDVVIREYPSGIACLEAMLRGEAQLATASDIAFVSKALQEPSLRIVSLLGLGSGSRIVARKDRHISQPADLKDKIIGISPDTTSDYFLDMFLLANSIDQSQVRTVPMAPAKAAEALASGEVDAVSAFAIYAYEAERRLGENSVSWEAQGSYNYHWILVALESRLQSPEPVKRALRALLKAQDYSLAHRDEAKAIIVRRLKIDPGYMEQAWDKVFLDVTLNQTLLSTLDSLARWKWNRQGNTGNIPVFLDRISSRPLEEVDPRAVKIIR